MVNKSSESGHSCLVPDLRKKGVSFSTLSIMFAVGFSCMAFLMLKYDLSKPILLKTVITNDVVLCQMLFLHLLR